jgi:ABC-type multidrug transport system fused ATPase/permease subunit
VNTHHETSNMQTRRAIAGKGGHQDQARGLRVLVGLSRDFLRPYPGSLCIIAILIALQAAGSLYLPTLNADIINNGVVAGNVGYIWRSGGIMMGIVFVLVVDSVISLYLSSRVAMGAGAALRAAVYRRVQAFSSVEMNRFGIPSLVTRNLNDVGQVQAFFQVAVSQLGVAVFVCVGSVIMAVRESAKLSLVLVVTFPAMGLVVAAILSTVIPQIRAAQVTVDRINQVLRDQITGVRVIRAFLRVRSEQDRFQVVSTGNAGITLRIVRAWAPIVPALTVVANLSVAGVFWFGGRLVSENSMSIGTITAYVMYITLTVVYLGIPIAVITMGAPAVACAERIRQVTDAELAITDPSCPVTPAAITGQVEFRQVTFGYSGSERPVLDDVTFTLRPGQISAIIGGTGSGKTTVLSLIFRFFDVTSGSVLVNGTDVREQSADEFRSTIGLVPQASYLFSGTVASNLRFGAPEATDQELWRVLDIAQALDFVASMPGQLDAPIDQGGTNVSGGQRQRLSIARALLRRPSLYLFDDSFSALDPVTDARLRSGLRAETQDAAVLIVAQRVSTIMHADQIIVLEGGSVVGIGTHEQLLDSCGPYREIAASQLGEGVAA